jgi:hypothetical protein
MPFGYSCQVQQNHLTLCAYLKGITPGRAILDHLSHFWCSFETISSIGPFGRLYLQFGRK